MLKYDVVIVTLVSALLLSLLGLLLFEAFLADPSKYPETELPPILREPDVQN